MSALATLLPLSISSHGSIFCHVMLIYDAAEMLSLAEIVPDAIALLEGEDCQSEKFCYSYFNDVKIAGPGIKIYRHRWE